MNKSIASTQGQKNKRYSVKKPSIAHFFVSQSRLTDAVSVIFGELLSYEHPPKHREVLGNNCFVRESEALFCVWQNEYTPEEHKVEIQMDFFRRGKGEQYTRDGEQFCEWAWEDEELTAMLEAEHFEVLGRWGGYDRAPVMPTTQRMVYVTRRR